MERMMRKVMGIAAALGVLGLSTSSMAQTSASGTVQVTATVLAACSINSVTNAGSLGSADFTSPGLPAAATTSIAVGAQTSGSTAGNVANCNVPTHVTLSSANGASVTTGTVTNTTQFQKHFDYTAAATFSGVTTTLNTLTNPASGAVESITSSTATAGADAGSLGIVITSLTPAKQLISGSYADTLTITLTAN